MTVIQYLISALSRDFHPSPLSRNISPDLTRFLEVRFYQADLRKSFNGHPNMSVFSAVPGVLRERTNNVK